MRKQIARMMCAVLALVLLCCASPATAWAEATTNASGETEATTTTTAAVQTVELTQLRIKGSNSKIYLCTPTLSSHVNKYSFSVPDWMEVVTVTFAGAEGIAATCSNGQPVISTGTSYSVSVELTEAKQTVKLALSKGDLSREIEITIVRKKIDCFIEDIMLFNGDNEITPKGEVADGVMTFTLPSGALDDITLRVKPRHENIVSIANTTDKLDGETVAESEKHKLTVNRYSTYYPVDLSDCDDFANLEEGTNTYYVEVTAGDIIRICDVVVIVGDPLANATTTTTTTTTLPTTTTTTAPVPTTAPTSSMVLPPVQGGNDSSGSLMGDIPTVLWILIGIIALVVIGSCMFMIVSMTNNNRRNMNGYNGNYNYDYDRDYRQPPRRRRNLTEYLEDDYEGYNRGRGGRYDDYDRYDGYENYDNYDNYDQPPRRSSRYDSYDNYDNYDNYEQPPRRHNYDDFDDFNDDGFGGYR